MFYRRDCTVGAHEALRHSYKPPTQLLRSYIAGLTAVNRPSSYTQRVQVCRNLRICTPRVYSYLKERGLPEQQNGR